MKKKIFGLILSVCMVMGLLVSVPTSVQAETYENALFPMQYLNISQGVNGSYSHQGTYAIDIIGQGGGIDNVFAPYTGTIKKIYAESNTVWFQSNSKVQFADGTIDYMTTMFTHDNDISDLYVGKVITQGTVFYQEGRKGNATGDHIHFQTGRGTFNGSGWYENSSGKWMISNAIHPADAVFLQTSTVRINDYGYNWRTVNPTLDITSANIPNGVYSIQWKSTNTYVSAGNTDEMGYDTFVYEPGKNGDLDLDQKFSFERLSNGTYKIISQRSGLAIEVDNESKNDQAHIQQWHYNNIASQQWFIVYRGDGYYKFINKNSGKALDYGDYLQQWTDNNSDAQKFKIEAANHTKSSELSNGIYCIKSKKNGLYVSAGNTDEIGYDTFLFEASQNGMLDTDQQFYFERLINGAYKITSQRSGMVLEVDNLSYNDEAVVQQWNYNNIASQQWIVVNCGDEYYKFINKNSGKALDNGDHLQQWTDNNTDAQRFAIIPMSFQIKYNANGGIGDFAPQSKTYLKNISLANNQPRKQGYLFQGWSESPDATAPTWTAGSIFAENRNITLYACWKPIQYSIIYSANGGTGTISNSSYVYDTTKKLNKNVFYKAGYRFKDWNTKADGTGTSYSDEMDIKNLSETDGTTVTLYAQWESTDTYTASTVTKSLNSYVINISLFNVLNSSKIIVVGYKGTQFNSMSSVDYTKDTETLTLNGDIDTIKVMIWNSVGKIKPVTRVEVIPKSKWITG